MTAPGLSPEHRAELNGSRISADLIESRGYRTVTSEWRERLVDLGCPAWAVREDDAFPGLVVPMYDVKTGQYNGYQFKPAVPQLAPGKGKATKYVSPRGMSNRLDVHPMARAAVLDPSRPLWITEGMKKADSIATHGLAVLGLTGVWNWRRDQATLAEWEDVPLKGRTVIVCFDSDAMTNPQVRHAMNRLVGWLRKKTGADGHVYYLPVPAEYNGVPVKGVDDYFAAGGTPATLSPSASERPPLQQADRDAQFTDAFLTDTVCSEALSGRFLFTGATGWMRYDGVKWSPVNEAAVTEEIRVWAKVQWDDVVEEYKNDQSREVSARMENWRRVLTNSRLKALVSLARGPLLRDATEFDSHPDLLNTPSGVVYLRTGELLEGDPAYLMTKVTGVPYDPAATSPDFDTALTALPVDVQGWYQTRMGQALTGYMTPDDIMIIQQGTGENGKSTLSVPLSVAAGSYQVLVSHRVILGRADQHPTELMDLMGARLALMEETPEARQLNVQQLKQVVGTPEITARKIQKDSVTFKATHSLFINTNFTPTVNETDHATWRRLALVVFPYTFRKRAEDVRGPLDRLGDPALRDRLSTDPRGATAALTWMVRGAVAWYRAGKVFGPLPDRVTADTREWRGKGDLIHTWLEERCAFEPDATAQTTDLFQSFGQWLVTNNHKPWTPRLFHDRLVAHETVRDNDVTYERRKIAGQTVRQWGGIRLLPVNPNYMG